MIVVVSGGPHFVGAVRNGRRGPSPGAPYLPSKNSSVKEIGPSPLWSAGTPQSVSFEP